MEIGEKMIPKPIRFGNEFIHQVDIIIPFHGQYASTTELIESIFKLTRSNYYKIYLVDDASPNAHFINNINLNAKKRTEKTGIPSLIQTIRLNQQRGFGGACKVGFEAGESPYVCFIQSDCLIEELNWLNAMGASLMEMREKQVRVITPMTDNPATGCNVQKRRKEERSGDVILEEPASLFTFMCHRELFSRIGGFLQEYRFAGYEDEEFFYRLKHYGYSQGVSGKSWVKHKGGLTIKDVMRRNPNEGREAMDENRERCIEDIKALKKNVVTA